MTIMMTALVYCKVHVMECFIGDRTRNICFSHVFKTYQFFFQLLSAPLNCLTPASLYKEMAYEAIDIGCYCCLADTTYDPQGLRLKHPGNMIKYLLCLSHSL